MWNPQRDKREGGDKEISTNQIPERESLQRFPATAETCLGLQEDLNDLFHTILCFSLFYAVDLGGSKCNRLSRGFGIFLLSEGVRLFRFCLEYYASSASRFFPCFYSND